MREELTKAVQAIRDAVGAMDPKHMRADEAERIVELFAEGERLCQAGRSLAAQRVLRTKYWRAQGFRTPAQWLAARTKGTLSQAITSVETAHRLDSFPSTREGFATGRLSEVQVAEITAAASTDPAAEEELLAIAARDTVSELRERCRQVRASAVADEDACERIRRSRYLRHWNDRDGAVRVDARLAPDDGARVILTLAARAARLQTEAQRSGQREPNEAYAADALVAMASGAPGPAAIVHVHVDRAALERGHTVTGERCFIPGVGPIAVSTAQKLADEGIVKALATSSADVHAVSHLGRTIPARVRTALEARDQTCVVPGCEVRSGLEIDHIIPFARGGPTSLENLARLCRYHHAQKSRRGWRLEGRPGSWEWTRGAGSALPKAPARAP